MSTLEYLKSEKVYIKNTEFDEKWLQDRIEDDPTILGLGDLNIIERERQQSSGGRIDFLFYDPEIETMYETEIQLGSTDESHIIRTIEYWDIERRRYQSKEHKAVLVAEDITNRFFNVISLMNRSIPIIAIQLNAIRVENSILLNFTKVLDLYEEPGDEEALGSEKVDRHYWEQKTNERSLKLLDDIVEIFEGRYKNLRLTYNKGHVALGTIKRNFMWIHPRKTEGYCHINLKTGTEDLESTKARFEEMEIPVSIRKNDIIVFPLYYNDFKDNKEGFSEIFINTLSYWS